MMKKRLTRFVCVSIVALVSTSANSSLVDIGNGMIYDSVQDLTWTQNAGMFYGPKYDYTTGSGTFYQGADTWAANLEFGGFDDWRLPTTLQFDDPTCSGDIRYEGDYQLFYETRAGCTGGEMELLTELYDPANNPIFSGIGNSRYWTDTPYRDGLDPCLTYPTYEVPCGDGNNGDRTNFYWQWGFEGFEDSGGEYDNVPVKTTLRGSNFRYAWAVRDGDASAVPLPAAMWLFASGLIGLVGISRRRKTA